MFCDYLVAISFWNREGGQNGSMCSIEQGRNLGVCSSFNNVEAN